MPDTRTAYLINLNVDHNGNIINKSTASISSLLSQTTSVNVIQDGEYVNTQGNPTLKEYLKREAVDGYYLVKLTNAIIITSNAITSITPLNVQNLFMWWKADALYTDDGSIAKWQDSVNNYVASSTSGNRPTYIAGAGVGNINGLPVISFVHDFLQIASQAFLKNVAGFTILTVFRYNSTSYNNGAVFDAVNRATVGHYTSGSNRIARFSYRRLDADAITNIDGPVLVNNTVYKTVALADFNSGSARAYLKVNDVVYTGSVPSVGLTSNTNVALGIGIKDWLVTREFDGQIAEVIVYNRALSDSELVGLDSYLSRYGL
jgi:hypothetical protein